MSKLKGRPASQVQVQEVKTPYVPECKPDAFVQANFAGQAALKDQYVRRKPELSRVDLMSLYLSLPNKQLNERKDAIIDLLLNMWPVIEESVRGAWVGNIEDDLFKEEHV